MAQTDTKLPTELQTLLAALASICVLSRSLLMSDPSCKEAASECSSPSETSSSDLIRSAWPKSSIMDRNLLSLRSKRPVICIEHDWPTFHSQECLVKFQHCAGIKQIDVRESVHLGKYGGMLA